MTDDYLFLNGCVSERRSGGREIEHRTEQSEANENGKSWKQVTHKCYVLYDRSLNRILKQLRRIRTKKCVRLFVILVCRRWQSARERRRSKQRKHEEELLLLLFKGLEKNWVTYPRRWFFLISFKMLFTRLSYNPGRFPWASSFSVMELLR